MEGDQSDPFGCQLQDHREYKYDLVHEVRSTYTATEWDPAEKYLGWKVV